jgi:hypothetical protein
VKKLLSFFLYGLFFLFALALFIPKSSLYYLAEKSLKEYDITISDERVHESLLSLEVSDLKLALKGISSADISSVRFVFLGVYNSIELRQLRLSSLVDIYLPPKIQEISIEYSLLTPLSVTIDAQGDFGLLSGELNLMDLRVNARLKPSKLMLHKYRNSLRFFKKSQKGEYNYAKAL